MGQLGSFGDGWGVCRLCGRGGGRGWWRWRSRWRRKVFYFGGGYLYGSEAIVGEVVGHDAEKVFAFGRSADLLTILDAVGDVFLKFVERGGYAELGA